MRKIPKMLKHGIIVRSLWERILCVECGGSEAGMVPGKYYCPECRRLWVIGETKRSTT